MELKNELTEGKNEGQEEQREVIKKTSFMGGLITGLLVAACITCGAFFLSQIRINSERNVLETSQVEKPADGTEGSEESQEAASVVNNQTLSKMQTIEQIIDLYFYQEDIDKETMADEIYRGMMAALDDPYSAYYSVEELQAKHEQTEGIYYGIGAYVAQDEESGLVEITGIIENTPAQEADLRAGDLIYMVEDVNVYGMDSSQVVALIKGEEGTSVHLTLIRDGEQNYLEKDVIRRRIESPTVNTEMYENGIGYLQIIEFDDVTSDQFAEGMAVLRANDMKGLILDLRGNPGGNLDTVVEIAQMMLPEGLIVHTEDRQGNREEYRCDGRRQLDIPLVVLVNDFSASASEILAGAIKDYGIGTLLGTTTYGKGIVQRILPLSDGSAVQLTVSDYFTPSGKNIHGVGIAPDIEIEFDAEAYYTDVNPVDNQLEKAKEVLLEMIQ